MPSPINLTAILIANIMGLTILFCVSISSVWTAKLTSTSLRYLRVMLRVCVLSCIADPLCCIADGRPGVLSGILVWLCNNWLYVGNLILAIYWIYLVAEHVGLQIARLHKYLLRISSGVALLILAANLFYPIIFTIDEQNVYARLPAANFYFVLHFLYMLDALFIYLYVRKKSGNIKFFPIWAFIVPAALGELIQLLCYGVSTITPFITVSIACMTSCLQNEFLYRDKLTGLYNRFYLDTIERMIEFNGSRRYTAMMLDINSFKLINDRYGHKEGDLALVRTAELLRSAVKENGEVIRYAGDEFIVILSTQDDAKVEKVVSDIHDSLDRYNAESGKPYELSVALGYCKLDIHYKSLDSIFDQIDKLMYEDKRKYYETHDRRHL